MHPPSLKGLQPSARAVPAIIAHSRPADKHACLRGHSGTLAQATRPILGLMKSAWLNLRRSWYFVGPYSDTADFTIMVLRRTSFSPRSLRATSSAGRFAWPL